jgi:hypothetical protein
MFSNSFVKETVSRSIYFTMTSISRCSHHIDYHEEGRKRREPATQGGVGWNPREPMGVPSSKLLESTEGDSADKVIICNRLNIWV